MMKAENMASHDDRTATTRPLLQIAIPAALASLLFASAPAAAHPHVFIGVRVEVQFDDTGAIRSMNQRWLFDELFSALIAEDIDADGNGQPDDGELGDYLVEVMRSLRDYGYYTELVSDGAEVPLVLTGDMFATLDGSNLQITFTVMPEQTVALSGGEVTYRVFDPTYYIDVLHADADEAIVLSGAPAECTHRVIAPNPDAAMVDLAASLDQTMSASDTLGAFFAGTVFIACGPSS